jgi:hypothetical protein
MLHTKYQFKFIDLHIPTKNVNTHILTNRTTQRRLRTLGLEDHRQLNFFLHQNYFQIFNLFQSGDLYF